MPDPPQRRHLDPHDRLLPLVERDRTWIGWWTIGPALTDDQIAWCEQESDRLILSEDPRDATLGALLGRIARLEHSQRHA